MKVKYIPLVAALLSAFALMEFSPGDGTGLQGGSKVS